MAAPTGATLPLPSKKKNFHLIRPVCALGTFPSRGRLEKAFLFLVLWFFDSLSLAPAKNRRKAQLAKKSVFHAIPVDSAVQRLPLEGKLAAAG